MGNHEWCEDCETSDFHLGRPCDPELVKAVQERKRKLAEEEANRVKKLKAALNKAGFKYRINSNGEAVISSWDIK